MDVNQTNTIAPAQPDGRRQNQGRERPFDSDKQQDQDGAPSGSWRELDAVNVNHGLIDALTPEVQGIIDALNREIEPLRRQLASANHQIEELKNSASLHSFLDIPNRQQLFRELGHVLAHQAVFTEPPSLALLHVANADEIREQFGRVKLDDYLSEISNRIKDRIRQTDSLGNIGGSDFALIILGVESERAKQDVSDLVAKIISSPVVLGQSKVDVRISAGVANLGGISSPEMAVRKADEQLVA